MDKTCDETRKVDRLVSRDMTTCGKDTRIAFFYDDQGHFYTVQFKRKEDGRAGYHPRAVGSIGK